MSFIRKLRLQSWRPIDRRPIYESLADDLILPQGTPYPGAFDIANSPWIKEPLDAIATDGCKRVLVSGAAQLGKTLFGIIFVIWCVLRRPGITTWNGQTDPAIRKFAEDKAWPLLRACKSLMALLPADRNKVRTRSIVFPSGSVRFQGASENNSHGDTVANQINDERHLWKPGLIYKFDSRVGSMPNAKQLDLSTGSIKYGTEELSDGTTREFGDDFFNQCRDATQEIWSVKCPGCGRLQPLAWKHRDNDGSDLTDSNGKQVFGIVWDENSTTRQNGRWNFAAVKKTARWKCQADALDGMRHRTSAGLQIADPCNFELTDTPDNIRTLNAFENGARYQVTNPLADPAIRSFRFPAMVSELVGWGTLVVEWLKAQSAAAAGDFGPLKTFIQNRLAEAWDASVTIQGESRATGDYDLGTPWLDESGQPIEFRRRMTVDRQRGKDGQGVHFWVLVRDWNATHGSRLVSYEQLKSYQAIRDRQLELGIKDAEVLIDAGDQAREVYAAAAQYGWTCLQGRDVEDFPWPNPKNIRQAIRKLWSQLRRGDPAGVRAKTKGATRARVQIGRSRNRFARLFLWSNPGVKDILAALMSGNSSYWGRPRNEPREYTAQINSEIKKQVKDKRGRLRWMWIQTCDDNHARDCEAMQVLAALMSGLIKPDAAPAPQPVPAPEPKADEPEKKEPGHLEEIKPGLRRYILQERRGGPLTSPAGDSEIYGRKGENRPADSQLHGIHPSPRAAIYRAVRRCR